MHGFIGIFAVALLLAGCPAPSHSPSRREGETGRYTIVATTAMVGELARRTAGDHAEVVSLIGEGVDPHLFRPTSDDIGKLIQADLVLYSGLMLEGAMEAAFRSAERSGKKVVAVTSGLSPEALRTPATFEGRPDPHVWNDAGLWAQCLDRVAEVLSEYDPEHAADYQQNAAEYRKELEQIDQYARDCVASIPESSRVLVTAHDAFGYFSHAYAIEERSVQGITTESESGVQDINNLVDFLVKRQVSAVFVEATVNDANLRAVIEGAKKKGWKVAIGGKLFSDSMGSPETYEGTYVGMMDHNVTTITRALGGTAPEAGMNGKLSVGMP